MKSLTYWGYQGIGENHRGCPKRAIRRGDYSACDNWAWVGVGFTAGGIATRY